jgi:hypothetical protein
VLPEALIVAYRATENERYKSVATAALDFLISQSFEGDVCMPVGQAGWFHRGGKIHRYDQQPEEVAALVCALRSMANISDDPKYQRYAALAFEWFLGNNALNQVVYTHFTGGCYDGIHEETINLNQGAESTVSYLLARLAMGKSGS